MAAKRGTWIAVVSATAILIGIVLLALAVRNTILARYAAAPPPPQGGTVPPAPGGSFPDPVGTLVASLLLRPPLPQPPPPTPPPLPTPPSAVSLPHAPGLAPDIAWGVETSSTLTIWVGHYSDTP